MIHCTVKWFLFFFCSFAIVTDFLCWDSSSRCVGSLQFCTLNFEMWFCNNTTITLCCSVLLSILLILHTHTQTQMPASWNLIFFICSSTSCCVFVAAAIHSTSAVGICFCFASSSSSPSFCLLRCIFFSFFLLLFYLWKTFTKSKHYRIGRTTHSIWRKRDGAEEEEMNVILSISLGAF